MARTIKEIANGMKADFVRNSKMQELYGWGSYDGTTENDALAWYNSHVSAVSVESVLIGIVAACVAVVENLMDFHKKEVDTAIARERYGHAGWYEQMALKFQYGDGLSVNYSEEPDAPATDGNFAESTEYATVDPEKQIVKYAYCEDDDEDGRGVRLKVAKDDNGDFAPLTSGERSAFVAYIQRIKPAGVPVEVISEGPDTLSLKLTVYYNPLVLDSDGNRISGEGKPVDEAIDEYINSIGFNGWFTEQALVDAVQQADGVEVVGFDHAIVNRTGQPIEKHRLRPYSGYVSVDFNSSDYEIEYIANVKVRN